jgi:hypothetical protein
MCRTNRWGAFKDERIDPVARPPSNKPLSLYIYRKMHWILLYIAHWAIARRYTPFYYRVTYTV